MKRLIALARNEAGATAIEYGLIVALITIVAIAGISNVGGKMGGMYNEVSNKLP